MHDNLSRVLRDEWIGRKIRFDGRIGIVRDETMFSFKVEIGKTMKTIMKSAHTFVVETHDGQIEVNGKLLQKRSHDRLKIR